MSTLLALPFRPVIDQNGNFESGAVMTVFKAGSSTLEPIYEDSDLTTPLSNPLTADAYGVFPAVYFSDTQTVRVRIEEASGTTLFDLDPYISTAFDAEAILDQALTRATEAATSAAEASTILTSVQGIEAAVEALVSPTYTSIANGLAGTSDGEYFAVLVGDVLSIYLNDAGGEVLQRSTLSATAINTELANKADTSHTHAISDVTNLQTSLDAKAPLADPALTGTPTTGGIEIGFRSVPRSTTSGTAVVGDNGKCIAVSAGLTIPNSVFSAGHAVSIYNDSASDVTITQGSGLTLRHAGTTDTGNRTLAARGLATIWFNTASEGIISGPGVS